MGMSAWGRGTPIHQYAANYRYTDKVSHELIKAISE
jgi:hypothetical protein